MHLFAESFQSYVGKYQYQCTNIQTKVIAVLLHGGLNIPKLHSNNDHFRDNDTNKSLSPEHDNITTILGVIWDHIIE